MSTTALDEEIEYIGSRFAMRLPHDLPIHPSPRLATGIIFHVQNPDLDEPRRLMFRRATTNVIEIGRRPGIVDDGLWEEDSEVAKAMFRCAVVSRKHAKVAFSDTGHAYLIDLNSHHGTFLRKFNEVFARRLTPETPTLLGDGDFITFGKSVGRNNDYVRPIIVKTEILNGPQSDVAPNPALLFKPLIVPASNDSFAPHRPTGRFGIFTPSSPDRSSSVGFDSDIEEVPPPLSRQQPSSSSQARKDIEMPGRNFDRAFEVLKRLLPPVRALATPPRMPAFPMFTTSSPAGSPEYNSGHSSDSSSHSSDEDAPLTPLEARSSETGDHAESQGQKDGSESPRSPRTHSRSTSPMDLASPSPGPSPFQWAVPPPEPPIVGAWPTMEDFAPSAVDKPDDAPHTFDGTLPLFDFHDFEEPPVQCSTPPRVPSPAPDLNAQGAGPIEAEQEKPEEPVPEVQTNDVNAPSVRDSALVKLQNEVSQLQFHRRKYKNRFNANVRTIAEKLVDLDERIVGNRAEVDDVRRELVQISDLQCITDALREKVDTVMPLLSRVPQTLDDEREKAQRELEAIKVIVDDMKSLHERAQQQFATDVDAIRQAREEALADIVSARAETLATLSLKRKRSEEEAEDSEEESSNMGTMTDGSSQQSETDSTTLQNATGIDVPAPKRARTIARVVAHTATAVTLGAVVTWSALAFS